MSLRKSFIGSLGAIIEKGIGWGRGSRASVRREVVGGTSFVKEIVWAKLSEIVESWDVWAQQFAIGFLNSADVAYRDKLTLQRRHVRTSGREIPPLPTSAQ